MGNLIPEVRVNKNGVAVTKHVRADTSQPSKALSGLGAPKLAAPAVRKSAAPKVRKVPTKPSILVTALGGGRPLPDKAEASDDQLYRFLSAGVSAEDGIALTALGIDHTRLFAPLAEEPGEIPSRFAARAREFDRALRLIEKRRERYAEVSHRLRMADVPPLTASKCLDNGLSLKALKSLTTEEAIALFSKVARTGANTTTIAYIESGVIPFRTFEEFGIRVVSRWLKSAPVFTQMDPEVLRRVIDKPQNRTPSVAIIGDAEIPEANLIELAAQDPRVLDLRIPELMWHGFRTDADGGRFNYDEARAIDDFIHEVRSLGVTDLTDKTVYRGDALREQYPAMGDREPQIHLAELDRWIKAGLRADQIIRGMQNRWSLEQSVAVFDEGISGALADGLL